MTLTELAELVRRMRSLQKKYFSTKNPDCLADAKRSEQAVDKAVEEALAQKGLFDDGETS